jgi:hypothetical protein
MTITEFLLARIEEDEMRASSGWSSLRETRWDTDNYGRDFLTPSAVLAECKAKRAISELHTDRDGDCEQCSCYGWFASTDGPHDYEEFPCPTLRALAAVYADHPDYLPEWAL